MKSYKKELWFNIPERVAFINITKQVEDALHESGIKEGLCLINAMHITASVFINDNERGLHEDYKRWLEELAPHEPISQYLHNRTGEDNGTASQEFCRNTACRVFFFSTTRCAATDTLKNKRL